MEIAALYDFARQQNIEVLPFSMPENGSMSIMMDNGSCIIGMDDSNRRDLIRMLRGDPEGKVSLLLDYTSRPGPIADPWYTGDFDATYRDVREGCEALLELLMKE